MMRRALVSTLCVFTLAVGCTDESAGGGADAGSVEPDKATSQQKAASSEDDKTVQQGADSEGKLALATELPDVVDQALPAVVGISTKRVVDMRRRGLPFGQNPFRGMPFGRQMPERKREREGIGSGVIVDKDGTIITNHHVVKEADEISVSLHKQRKKFDAEVVGTDEATDIAILRMKSPPDDLQPIEFGNSDALRLGEPIVAIGNPFGLSGTVTYGIVSAKGRANVGLADFEDFIQTDAAINPGNSGGALVSLDGKLVGINTAILSRSGGYQGIGFAIPSKMAKSVMTKLVETGEVRRGYLGVMIQTLNPDLAEALDISEKTRGVVLSDVESGTPAEQAGLKRHDVILKFEGEKVETSTDLRNRVAQKSPGDEVQMTVLRGGEKMQKTVELGSRTPEGTGAGGPVGGDILDGLSLSELDQEARRRFRVPERLDGGVVVTGIEPGTPAGQTELRPGDVIIEVNREPVESVGEFREAYGNADRTVLLTIVREGSPVLMTIPKGG